jgi:hypothetical protein
MQGLEIRGLSLTRPWPFAIVNGPKDEQKRIENRSWKPPRRLVGHFLALHAAKSWSESDRQWITEKTGLYVPKKDECPHSVIFAVCMLGGWIEHDQDHRLLETQRKWFFGPFGWLLVDVVRLVNPVPCVGAMGLWTFEKKQEELAQLRVAYKESLGLRLVA